MILSRTAIPDVITIDPKVFGDTRGYFAETFRQQSFDDFIGYHVDFVQDNESKSNRGVLRGLHYQLPPAAQAKLVRVIKGRVIDVAVDVRRGSPTFGKWVAVELSGENKRQMYVPHGFAHGFAVLEDETILVYKVDNYYAPESERGIAWNDPALGIDWGLDDASVLLSQKDKTQPLLRDAELFRFEN